ncbi:MAG TPA: carbamoyl phosphate synthase small subunit, partial [Bacillota bacterium]|nr:carbamoyl phosphate synthase small subunit [Bacillota bacterium]
LKRNGVPGIYGIDTRALTIKIREEGTKIGVIMNGAKDEIDIDEANRLIASYDAKSVVPLVSPKERAFYPAWVSGWEKDAYVADAKDEKKSQLVRSTTDEKHAALYRVAVLDFGAKHNILWNLVKRGCEVYDCPWNTSAEEILSLNPDGIFLSNGPGDPTNCGDAITEIKKLYDTGIPMFGICLGHQLMALATGAKTRKLKYGHRGANHPVKDIKEDRVYITSQNHGYVVVDESVDPKVAVVSHVNVNDGTNEGLDYLQKPVFTVQYHPEGAPGPQDNNYLFDQFIDLIEKNKKK